MTLSPSLFNRYYYLTITLDIIPGIVATIMKKRNIISAFLKLIV